MISLIQYIHTDPLGAIWKLFVTAFFQNDFQSSLKLYSFLKIYFQNANQPQLRSPSSLPTLPTPQLLCAKLGLFISSDISKWLFYSSCKSFCLNTWFLLLHFHFHFVKLLAIWCQCGFINSEDSSTLKWYFTTR